MLFWIRGQRLCVRAPMPRKAPRMCIYPVGDIQSHDGGGGLLQRPLHQPHGWRSGRPFRLQALKTRCWTRADWTVRRRDTRVIRCRRGHVATPPTQQPCLRACLG